MAAEKTSYPPKITQPSSKNVLIRDRLHKQIDSAKASASLVWISAPGGSGKTTLLSSYLQSKEIKSIWYQIDEGDADPATFFHYMGLAGKKAAPRRKKTLPALTPEYLQGLTTFTRRFFEEIISRLGAGGVIVLDNYQLLEDSCDIAKLLSVIVDTVAGQLTLVVVSRNKVPPYLANLQAKGELVELDFDSIRFNEQEWLSISPDVQDKKEQFRKLHQRMDGWVSGLMLCRDIDLDMLNQEDQQDLINEPLFNYFAHEFFLKLDESSQRLLTCCSYLYHFNEKLATKISGVNNSSSILRNLLNKNYFIQKQGVGYYTLHPLFRTYLQEELNSDLCVEEINKLKLDSANILVSLNEYEAAAKLYIELEAWDLFCDFAINNAGSLFVQGRIASLKIWLEIIPEELKKKNNWLLYWEAVLYGYSDIAKSLGNISLVFDRFVEEVDKEGAWQSWNFAMQMMNGTWMETDRIPEWLSRFTDNKIMQGENVPSYIESQFIANLCMGYMLCGLDPESTEFWLDQNEKATDKCQDDGLKSVLSGSGLFVSLVLGYTKQAKKYLRILNDLGSVSSFPPLQQMYVLCNKMMGESFVGDPVVTQSLYLASQKMSDEYGILLFEGILQITTLMAELSLSNVEQAKIHLQKAEQIQQYPIMNKINTYWGEAQLRMFQARYDEAEKSCETAIKLLTEEAKIPTYAQIIKFTHIESILEQGKIEEAQALLKSASDEADELHMPLSQIRACLLQARLAMEKANESETKAHLIDMFCLAKKYDLHIYCGWVPGKLISWACERAVYWNVETEFVKKYIRNLSTCIMPPGQDQEAWPWLVRIYTLGKFKVEIDNGDTLHDNKQDKRPLQLLKQLVLHSGSAGTRDLSDELYPGQSEKKQSAALRKNLHRLRLILGNENTIVREGDNLRINKKLCWIDSSAFELLIKSEQKSPVARALSMYQGEYMSQVNDESYDVLTRREQLRGLYLHTALDYISCLERDAAIVQCQNVLRIEPLSEVIYQKLMGYYKDNGRDDLVCATYEQCRRILHAELGVEPMPESRRLAGID